MPQKGRRERAGGPNTRIAQTQDDNGLIRNVILCNSKLGQGSDKGSYSSTSPTLDWTYSKENGYGSEKGQMIRSPAIAGVVSQPNGGNGEYKKSSYPYPDERPAFKSRVSISNPEYKIYTDGNYHTSEKEMRINASKYMMEKSFIQKNKDYIKQLQAKNAAEYNNNSTDGGTYKNIDKKPKGRPIYIPRYMGGKQSKNEDIHNNDNQKLHCEDDDKKVTGDYEGFNVDEETQFLDNIDKFLDNIGTNSDVGLLDALEETKKKIDRKIEEIKNGLRDSEGMNNLGESPFEDVQVINNKILNDDDGKIDEKDKTGGYEEDEDQTDITTAKNSKFQTDKEIIESIVNSVPPEERDALFVNE